MMTLGENVKFLRESKGLTFEAVGAAVGTDGQNIFNLEKRKSKVSKFAPALARFFGVDLDALTSSNLSSHGVLKMASQAKPSVVDHPTKSATLQAHHKDFDDAIELMAIFQQLSPNGRENVLGLARSILNNAELRWVRRNGHES